MLSRLFQVYAVHLPGGIEYQWTSDPLLDLRWWAENRGAESLTTLTPPIPLWLAARCLEAVGKSAKSERSALETVRGELKRWGRRHDFTPQRADAREAADVALPDSETGRALAGVLSGKALLEEEIYRGLRGRCSIPLGQVDALLRTLVLSGAATQCPGVGLEAFDHPHCLRCGERYRVLRVDCPLCGGSCFLCLECARMGESRGCSSLFLFEPVPGERVPGEPPRASLSFDLTAAQQNASQQLADALEHPPHEALVWAVCGAGKTEVAFEAISRALGRGKNVLYAVPRRDVVHELAPRLSAAFPQHPVAVLPAPPTGAPSAKLENAAIIAATTHQTMRFYHGFDLVILDEADAYPYAGSRMLYRAVHRARRPGGRLAFMTATPDDSLRRRVQAGELQAVRIPARHHGHPLAVPLDMRVRLPAPAAAQRLPQSVEHFVQTSLQRGARLIVFVPTVELAENVGSAFRTWAAAQNIQSDMIHSRLEGRDRILARFRDGTTRIMVSTTILERGITLPRTDVLVLYADHDIFDTGALIQMAGRAGRTEADPVGRVAFAHERESAAVREAVRIIQEMNEIAATQGYLHGRK